MKQTQFLSSLVQNPFIVTILTVFMDFIFFYMFMNADAGLQYLIIVFLAVLMNVFYIFYMRTNVYLAKKSDYKNYKKYLSAVVEEMEYATPTYEETVGLASEPIEEEPEEVKKERNIIELQKPKEIIDNNPLFDQPIQTEKYCDDLQRYMSDNGLFVDKRHIREMFASMATSKIIVFTNDHPELSERFIELFSDFIGASYSVDEDTMKTEPEDDSLSDEDLFEENLRASENERNAIHMLTYNHVDLEVFQHKFTDVIECASSPELPCEINMGTLRMEDLLPGNLWFLIIMEDFDQSLVNNQLSHSAVMLNITAKPVKPKEKVYQNPLKLSYEHMTNLLTEGYDTHFLVEDDWKRFDEVEEYLRQRASFILDNKLFRQLERYTSTFIMFGGDNKDAMDSVLHSKLLRLIHTIELNDINGNEDNREDILTVFEKVFGLENIPWSKTLLKSIGDKTQNTVQ